MSTIWSKLVSQVQIHMRAPVVTASAPCPTLISTVQLLQDKSAIALAEVDRTAYTMANAMQSVDHETANNASEAFPTSLYRPICALLRALQRCQQNTFLALRVGPTSVRLFVMVPSDADCAAMHAVLSRHNLLATLAEMVFPSELLPSNFIWLAQQDGAVVASNAPTFDTPINDEEDPYRDISNMSTEDRNKLSSEEFNALLAACCRWDRELLASIGASIDGARAWWVDGERVYSTADGQVMS